MPHCRFVFPMLAMIVATVSATSPCLGQTATSAPATAASRPAATQPDSQAEAIVGRWEGGGRVFDFRADGSFTEEHVGKDARTVRTGTWHLKKGKLTLMTKECPENPKQVGRDYVYDALVSNAFYSASRTSSPDCLTLQTPRFDKAGSELSVAIFMFTRIKAAASAPATSATVPAQAATGPAQAAVPPSTQPATQPSARKRIEDAVKVARELQGWATKPASRAPGAPAPAYKADLKGRGFLDMVGKLSFATRKDATAYLASRPWSLAYLDHRDAASLLPPEPAIWPKAHDAPALRTALKDTDPAIRAVAVEALAALRDPDDVPAIAALLGDDKPGVAALAPNMAFEAEGFMRDGIGGPDDALAPQFSWHERTVGDYAAVALVVMTGRDFTAKSFGAWWPNNKDALDCLWYWEQRLTTPSMEMAAALHKRSKDGWARYDLLAKAHREATLADLAKRPAETQAKVLLLANPNRGINLDRGDLAKVLSSQRAFELLEGKNPWKDVEMTADQRYFLDRHLVDQAASIFAPDDAERLLKLADDRRDGKLPYEEQLVIMAARALRPAKAGKLDDPDTADDLLRKRIREARGSRVRAALVGEIVRVNLPGNMELVKEQFFDNSGDKDGEVARGILSVLAYPTPTAQKRKALIELLTDKRVDDMLCDRPTHGNSFFESALSAVNAHASRQLVGYDFAKRLDLADEKLSKTAAQEFRQLVATLKNSDQPATHPSTK